jgi:hypothetical protein
MVRLFLKTASRMSVTMLPAWLWLKILVSSC